MSQLFFLLLALAATIVLCSALGLRSSSQHDELANETMSTSPSSVARSSQSIHAPRGEYVIAGFVHDEQTWAMYDLTSVILDVSRQALKSADAAPLTHVHIRAHEPQLSSLKILAEAFSSPHRPTLVYVHDNEMAESFPIDQKIPCVSELLHQAVLAFLPVPTTSTIKYYCASSQREKELLTAYEKDESYTVDNITSGIHALVLKSLLPKIEIKADPVGKCFTEEEKLLYPRILEYLRITALLQ